MDTIERILDLIESNNMTDIAIVKALSLSNGVVGQWRKRKQNPSTEAIVKLAQYFKVTTDYLLCLTDNKTTDPLAQKLPDDENELLDTYRKLDVSGKRQLVGKAFEFLDKKENAPAEKDESEEAIHSIVPPFRTHTNLRYYGLVMCLQSE